MNKVEKYKFHIDPGHGWLEVPVNHLKLVHIENEISACSYVSTDGKTAFLEEDCDMGVLLKAFNVDEGIFEWWWEKFVTTVYHDRPSDPRCFIRDLPSYRGEVV